MYLSWLAGAVDALERELKYYKNAEKEQQAIIAQLHRGYALPGEVTYIHPADLTEIVNNLSCSSLFSLYKDYDESRLTEDVLIHGTRYRQSPYMPKITRNFS